MQISSRFTIAIHIFACIDAFDKGNKITSNFLASSVNVNSVINGKLLSQLKSVGLVEVQRGRGGLLLQSHLKKLAFLIYTGP